MKLVLIITTLTLLSLTITTGQNASFTPVKKPKTATLKTTNRLIFTPVCDKKDSKNDLYKIIGFIESSPLPITFKHELVAFYQNALSINNTSYNYSKTYKAFKLLKNNYILVKTGNKPFWGPEKIFITQHNHIDEILKEHTPGFVKFTKRKKAKYLQAIKLINPWIQEFKQGINYNTTKTTYIADDDLLLLIPVSK